MKKVLLSLLAVAALVLSCQNYDDEFAALNSKVASLESQISSLAGLQTALTQVQSSVTALQAAVSAIPNLSSEVAAILADLSDLETAVSGATTSADLDALKAELNTTLAALQALIEANSTSIASVVAANADLKAQLEALGVDVDAVLAANSTFEGNLTITNAAELAYAKSLGTKVASIKGDVIVKVDEPSATAYRAANTGNGVTAAEVNTVLSQITFVVGNVRITTDASLDLSALTTVSGDYSVVGHDIDDSALASVGDDVYVDYDGPISFPALATADKIYVKGTYVSTDEDDVADATEDNELVIGTTSVNFMGLTKVTSISILNAGHTSGGSHTSGSSAVINDTGWPAGELYLSTSTTSVKIGQAPVTLVTGSGLTELELHYAADVSTTNTLGSAALASLSVTGAKITTATIMARTISSSVTFDVVGTTATSASGTVNLPKAVSIGAFVSDALENTLPLVATVGGFDVPNDLSVSLPELVTSNGNITLGKATSFSAPKLARVAAKIASGGVELNTAAYDITADEVVGSVSFPALTKAGDVVMNKVTSFSAPLAKVEKIDIEEATTTTPVTVELGSVSTWASPVARGTFTDPTAITTLKLHSQEIDPVVTTSLGAFTNATSIIFKGKAAADGTAQTDVSVTNANTKLASLELGGVLGTVSVNTAAPVATAKNVNTNTALAKVVTSGTIIDLTVENNFDLTTLTLGHTDDAKNGDAAVISIKNNANLGTFTTAVKRIKTLTITGNSKLTSFDLSSISELPANWTNAYVVQINISNNLTDPETQREDIYEDTDLTATATKDALAQHYGLKGTFADESASSARVYGQSSLATLKPFFAVLDAKYNPSTGNAIALSGTSYVHMSYLYDTTGTGTTPTTGVKALGGATAADATASGANADARGVEPTDFDEFAKLQ
jgi:hypothetical protein